jgi:hypothetical protein
MTTAPDVITRWKSPNDLERWMAKHFDRWVSATLHGGGAFPEIFAITTPGLTAAYLAEKFSAVHEWALAWQQAADRAGGVALECEDWTTRNFGRVRIPRSVGVETIEDVARLLQRSAELSAARERFECLLALDPRLVLLADYWPAVVALADTDFDILCRFIRRVSLTQPAAMRVREVACSGMHTKFLEQNRALLAPILTALGIPGNAEAKGWAGKLGFVDDETALFEVRDLDGALLPYPHFALPASLLITSPLRGSISSRLIGVVIVENAATFRALPPVSGVIAIFGRGDAVRILAAAAWLTDQPLLYAGDLDHAGFQMVAALRRGGLSHLETAFMDAETATRLRSYWVADSSRPGSPNSYVGLTDEERETQGLMAEGPWRLEQERIAFDLWVKRLRAWRDGCWDMQGSDSTASANANWQN